MELNSMLNGIFIDLPDSYNGAIIDFSQQNNSQSQLFFGSCSINLKF